MSARCSFLHKETNYPKARDRYWLRALDRLGPSRAKEAFMRATLLAAIFIAVTPAVVLAQDDSIARPTLMATNRPEVARYLEFFKGSGRDRMQRLLDRGSPYRQDIRTRLAARGLPSEFEFLPLIESGYSNTAVSRAGAVGMWQFIPSTARQYGLRVDRLVDERRDPDLATDAAIRHIGDLSRTFGSSLLTAAAYNGGAGRVRRGLSRLDQLGLGDSTGGDGFFDLASRGLLAQETRNYVPQLLAAAAIGRDPARYGFAADSGSARAGSDSVRVARALRLDQVARALGISIRRLADLNPALVAGVAPPSARIRVPAGLGDSLRLKLPTIPILPLAALVPPPDRMGFGALIRVRRGDSLEVVAARHGVGVAALRRVNALPKGYRLRPGMSLRLPPA